MPILVTAVVLVGALGAVNLVLAFAILRRLREHTEQLGHLPTYDESLTGVDRDKLLGVELPEFTAETVRSAPVSRASVTGTVELVGFFRPGCAPCHDQAPRFAEAGRTLGAGKVLALVAGSGSEADDLVQLLDGDTDVVLDPAGGEVFRELGLSAFPTFLRLDGGGAIVDAAVSVQELRTPVAPLARAAELPA